MVPAPLPRSQVTQMMRRNAGMVSFSSTTILSHVANDGVQYHTQISKARNGAPKNFHLKVGLSEMARYLFEYLEKRAASLTCSVLWIQYAAYLHSSFCVFVFVADGL